MKKYIELNNETFEVKEAKGKLHPVTQVRSLGDCYARPSSVKYEIYNDWLKWYLDCKLNLTLYRLAHFTINSYNTMMFTLTIDVFDIATDKFIGQLYITKTRHEFWTI